ncbi:MAG TPA: hypothetical protein VM243_20990 [Phycisphaerae bacterium]|nr:hypothetical protein [Phycisphaerae bacterium]
MRSSNRTLREIGMLAALSLVVGGCASGGGATGDVVPPGAEDNANTAGPQVTPPEFVAVNEGGGALAEDMGGATFRGQATGPLESGELILTLSADGVVTRFGGTLLGAFFGFPTGTEVIFDYETESVTGTYVGSGGVFEPLEDFLEDSEQYMHLTEVVVILVGDSFSVRTEYQTNVPSQFGGTQAIQFGATLIAPDDDELQGALGLPGHTYDQDPLFTLVRE